MKNPSIFQRLAINLGAMRGWRLEIESPLPEKCVAIGAPHTSNYDFFALLFFVFGTNTRLHWVGKHTLFAGPFGPMMRVLGGVPVNRNTTKGFVDRMIEVFEQEPVFRLAIAPEGTRKHSNHWKTGFYRIAVGANVPLIFGYVDYDRKVVGHSSSFMPTGNIDADFQIIKDFYADKHGKFPDNQGPVVLPPESDAATAQISSE